MLNIPVSPKKWTLREKERLGMMGLSQGWLHETCRKPKGNFRFHATLLLAEMLRIISNYWLEHVKWRTTLPSIIANPANGVRAKFPASQSLDSPKGHRNRSNLAEDLPGSHYPFFDCYQPFNINF
jgi:hypothetical protein